MALNLKEMNSSQNNIYKEKLRIFSQKSDLRGF